MGVSFDQSTHSIVWRPSGQFQTIASADGIGNSILLTFHVPQDLFVQFPINITRVVIDFTGSHYPDLIGPIAPIVSKISVAKNNLSSVYATVTIPSKCGNYPAQCPLPGVQRIYLNRDMVISSVADLILITITTPYPIDSVAIQTVEFHYYTPPPVPVPPVPVPPVPVPPVPVPPVPVPPVPVPAPSHSSSSDDITKKWIFWLLLILVIIELIIILVVLLFRRQKLRPAHRSVSSR